MKISDREEREHGKCQKSHCHDKVCSSFDWPKLYKLIDGVQDQKCANGECCENGVTHI